jgi:formyl-CoA transferase
LIAGARYLCAAHFCLACEKMSDSATEVTRSPLLGEHTEEVLGELGYDKAAIQSLREANVI